MKTRPPEARAGPSMSCASGGRPGPGSNQKTPSGPTPRSLSSSPTARERPSLTPKRRQCSHISAAPRGSAPA
eukprot:14822981-Alexandrium_andersonii.AAC.1